MIPNLVDYNTKKAKGLISVQRIDSNNYAISTKQFSTIDGSELSQNVVGVTISEIDNAITGLQQQINDLNTFKQDLQTIV